MMTNATLPIATEGSSELLSHVIAKPDSTFKILYFNLHGRGELIRNLLAYGGHKWEELPLVSILLLCRFIVFKCIPSRL